MKNINTQSTEMPDQIDGTYPPTREQLLAAGWRDEPPIPELQEGYTRLSIRLVEGDGVTGLWQCVDRLTPEIEAEAEQAEASRIVALAREYGGMVLALATYLSRVGWSIPCDASAVTADLLMRDLTDQLNAAQKEAKTNVADTYMLLTGVGVSHEDIVKIWEVIKP